MVQEEGGGGGGDGRGARETGERGRGGGGGRREGGRGGRPGDRGDARSAGLGAAKSLGGRRLHRAARGKEMARLAAGGRPGAPRAPLPGGGRPRARGRHARRGAPVEGQSGQGPGRTAGKGEGWPWPPAPLLPGPPRSLLSSQVPPLPPGAAAAAALLFVTEESRNVRNVPCVTYLGAENLCPAESARGNITSDEMTMIKISFSPAPSRARRKPGRRVAGRRGAGGWAAEGAGAWAHRSREGPGGGPGGKARAPGEAGVLARLKEGKQRIFVAERGRRGRAELIATLILCPAAQPSPEPGVAARSRSRSPRWVNFDPDRCPLRPGSAETGRGLQAKVGGWFSRQQSEKATGEERREERRWERREGSRRAARRGGGGGGREEGRRRGEGGEGRPRRAAPRGAARSGGRGGRGGWGEGWGRERK